MQSLKRYLVLLFGFFATIPGRIFIHKIKTPNKVNHSNWVNFLSEKFNKPETRILEIGSRVVTGANFKEKFGKSKYIGFDIHEGDNVNIVGDVHKLSSYFEEEKKFDLIFSSAVFEHLHMPWIAAEEINKLLNVNGYIFIETHFSFSAHERPWNFFQFSEIGLRSLFSEEMGYELIDSGLSNPIFGYFSHKSDSYLRYRPVKELYTHSSLLVKKVKDLKNFNWRDIDIYKIVDQTPYPKK